MGILARIVGWDRAAFAAINGGGLPLWDEPMKLISSDLFFWLVGLAVLVLITRTASWPQRLQTAAALLLGILVADAISVHLFKDVFERLRPCHDPLCQEQLRLAANACRGKFGFVSSHAANSATLLALAIRRPLPRWSKVLLVFWLVLTGWSRVHLGVHFPGDVLGGWLLGGLWALVWTKILSLLP